MLPFFTGFVELHLKRVKGNRNNDGAVYKINGLMSTWEKCTINSTIISFAFPFRLSDAHRLFSVDDDATVGFVVGMAVHTQYP